MKVLEWLGLKKPEKKPAQKRRVARCRNCKHVRTIIAHGLCAACYHKNRREVKKLNNGDHTAKPLLPGLQVPDSGPKWDVNKWVES